MKKRLLMLLVICAILMSSCYINRDVEQWQVGVKTRRNAIEQIVSAGVYSEAFCFFCELKTVNIDTVTFEVHDPEVLTADNQAVGLTVTIQARRKRDDESITNLMTKWRALLDDVILIDTISATAREGMKNGTRLFTLPELLDDRNGLADNIAKQLELDTSKYSTEIVNVTIENISVSEAYITVLDEKAIIRVQTEREVERQKLINQQADNDVLQATQNTRVLAEQLLVEQAKTAVEVEIASREGDKIEAANAVYRTNSQAYDLRRLELLQGVLSDKTVFFLPDGTDLSLILGLDGKVVPIGE